MAKLEYNPGDWDRAFLAIRNAARRGLVDRKFGTLPVQARLLAEHCIKLTPPKNREIGRSCIRADIFKVISPLFEADFDQPGVKALVARGDPAAWNKASQAFKGRLRGTQAGVTYTPAMHKPHRRKDGRVWARRPTYVLLMAGAIGDGGKKRKSAVQTSVERTAKFQFEKQGRGKAGWLATINRYGGGGFPQWITRHGYAYGSVQEFGKWTADGGASLLSSLTGNEPGVRCSNNTAWGGTANSARTVSDSIRARTHAMGTFLREAMRREVANMKKV